MAPAPAVVDAVAAVVLARGLGRRMRVRGNPGLRLTREQDAAAAEGTKGLMPMSADGRPGRPFLDYGLSRLADAGWRDVALVVAPGRDRLRAWYEGPGAPSRVALSFVVQAEPRGTADAVLSAREFVAGRPFLVLNADNLYPVGALRAIRNLGEPGLAAFEREDLLGSSTFPSARLSRFAVVDVAPDGTLTGIVEKPDEATMTSAGVRSLVSMNCWRFDERIFEVCRDVPRSARGEFELPDAVRLALGRGVTFRVLVARGPVLDLSGREDVPLAAAQLAGTEVRP